MPTRSPYYAEALADLEPSERAVLTADAAVLARFDELFEGALADLKGSPFWGFTSSGRYIAAGRMFRRAVELAAADVEAMKRAA